VHREHAHHAPVDERDDVEVLVVELVHELAVARIVVLRHLAHEGAPVETMELGQLLGTIRHLEREEAPAAGRRLFHGRHDAARLGGSHYPHPKACVRPSRGPRGSD
jgi:hypothetical protein